jgi:hypothetical protein
MLVATAAQPPTRGAHHDTQRAEYLFYITLLPHQDVQGEPPRLLLSVDQPEPVNTIRKIAEG